jgi:acyl-CoA oxidase
VRRGATPTEAEADQTVPLIDSFALSDHIVNSPLGKWDGSVYESYFAQVQASNPPLKEHPYFVRLIKPLLDRENTTIDDPEGEMGLDAELKEMADERASEENKGKDGNVEVRREDAWHDSKDE